MFALTSEVQKMNSLVLHWHGGILVEVTKSHFKEVFLKTCSTKCHTLSLLGSMIVENENNERLMLSCEILALLSSNSLCRFMIPLLNLAPH